MRSKVVLSFVGLCLSFGWLAACGDDVTVKEVSEGTLSASGESCSRSADCETGLRCLRNYCAAGEPSGEAGSGAVTPPVAGPVQSAEGESCTRTADCDDGLACVQQTCLRAGGGNDSGEGGAPALPAPKLGNRGETCQVAADCASGLTCVPTTVSGSPIGVCDVADYGLAPTGKSCGECAEAENCCQMPGVLQATYGSCSDIANNYLDGDPTGSCAATPAVGLQLYCFYYKTYCECAKTTWACTSGKCVYNAKCEANGDAWKGCPSYTRTSLSTGATICTDDGSCAATATVQCDAAADCDGFATADTSALCTAGECTCYENSCYAKCDEDLDCRVGYSCDLSKTKLCVPDSACTANEQCAQRLHDALATCEEGECRQPCSTDHDCSDSGGSFGAFSNSVCHEGYCEALGCDADNDCPAANQTYLEKQFCIDAPEGEVGGAPVSATND